jgi:nucleoside-diphosphate-sugar epimerase
MPEIVAITGAGGYVGSRIRRELAQRGTVFALTRRPANFDDIRWSFENQENLAEDLRARNVSGLVHAAWDFSAVTAAQIRRTNIEGSIRLFQLARNAGVRRIVFISTISAFAGARSLYGKAKLEVESACAAHGAVILRPGLVWGNDAGGVFGSIRKQVRSTRIIPLIGSGRAPQFLIPEDFLARTVADAACGRFDAQAGRPITIANPQPWPFRDLIRALANAEGRAVRLLPMPWPLLYAALRTGEVLGARLPFRSDSVTSFAHQDPAPDWQSMREAGIEVPPFTPATIDRTAPTLSS